MEVGPELVQCKRFLKHDCFRTELVFFGHGGWLYVSWQFIKMSAAAWQKNVSSLSPFQGKLSVFGDNSRGVMLRYKTNLDQGFTTQLLP